MPGIKTRLKINDNSGARYGICINLLGAGKKKKAVIGDLLQVILKSYKHKRKVKKKNIYLGLVVNVKFYFARADGFVIKFFSTAILIFSKQKKFLGTNVYGIVAKEIKIFTEKHKSLKSIFQRLLSYAKALM
jgi:large subunit ribosomal protein L14